ncbi:hypothetical protein CHU98_g5115 [Xylaria longipes]|nr:hypothetical protein CHU98_g5115 [Xylaria longipes]
MHRHGLNTAQPRAPGPVQLARLENGFSPLPHVAHKAVRSQPDSAATTNAKSIQGYQHIELISTKTDTLPSGRRLGYHAAGPITGTPSHVAKELNVRWIGPDRPDVGLSTPYDTQKVLDCPSDIQALAVHLGLKNYYLIGTGFALARAKDLSRSQLKGVGICAGIGPPSNGDAGSVAWRLAKENFYFGLENELVLEGCFDGPADDDLREILEFPP